MGKSALFCLALLTSLWVAPAMGQHDDEFIIEQSPRGIPVRAAILTRRYNPVETEDEVIAEELEAGYGDTDTFRTVGWRRAYRYGGWYGGYGYYGPAWYGGYGYYGPRYVVGYAPRFYGLGYGGLGYGYAGYYPYYGGFRGYWGGYAPMTYSTFYAPRVYYRNWGGCYYW